MLALCGLVFHGIAYQRRVDKGVQNSRPHARTRDRVVPRHGHADDGGGEAARRRGAIRQRLPPLRGFDGRTCLDPRVGRGLSSDARLARLRSDDRRRPHRRGTS